ncbi:MAG: hypothetical protein L0H63_00780 [Nitrococcus sp.]|nr:hypothetical protein [Nitrococcus sp.]
MRFNITGEQRRNPLLKTAILLFLAYIALLWLSNGLLYFDKMSLTYHSVKTYYLGDPETFQQPRSYVGMLEVAHFHLFAMGVLVLTLVHLMFFAPLSTRAKQFWMWAPFVFAVGDEGAGWLVRFVSPLFAYLKIATFIGLEVSLAGVIGITLWSLASDRRNSYAQSGAKAETSS